jgi:hypothetical protein
VATVEPLSCTLAIPDQRRETYLVIRDSEEHMVVTVIESLSPSNKRKGSDGWDAYLAKREQVLSSPAHFVELDLLRGGSRMPLTFQQRPPAYDYRVLVSRRERRPRADAYVWPLMHALPTITIPLMRGDADVPLDLQQVFAGVYDRAAYQRSLDYSAALDPALPPDVKESLNAALATTQ